MGVATDREHMSRISEKITGKKYCRNHNAHLPAARFAKFKNKHKCDLCCEAHLRHVAHVQAGRTVP